MKPLNPLMAVLAIASLGALPLRTLAIDGKTPTPVSEADQNPVNILAKVLKDTPAARQDAAKRIEDFLLKPDSGGKSFVSKNVNTTALGAVARDWAVKDDNVGRVAMLYFVIGPDGAAPGWTNGDAILSKTFLPGMKWSGRLRIALEDWTGKAQIGKKGEKKQATAFLNDAAEKAATVFGTPLSVEELRASIQAHDTTAVKVPAPQGNTATQLPGASRQYTLDDLYTDGAVVANVKGPKDKDDVTISMKIYQKVLPDGSTVAEIGIFSIEDTNRIVGQRFPIDSENQSFVLDDLKPGKRKYELTFGPADASGNRTITFSRPGGGSALKTTVSDLYTKRADQAEKMGDIVNVGGQEFYSLPQGGGRSGIALYSKAVIDGRRTGDARDLVPALYAEIGKPRKVDDEADGRDQRVDKGPKGGPHLGKIGDKEWHVEWDAVNGYWVAKEGPGDLPVPEKKEEAKTEGGKPGAGAGGAGGGGQGDSKPAGDGKQAIDDLVTLLLASTNEECTHNPDDIKELAKELQGQYSIVACKSAIDGLKQIVLVPKSEMAKEQQLGYGNTPDGLMIKRARFLGHYLIIEFDKQVQYLDLLKTQRQPDGSLGFVMVGFVDIKTKNAIDFRSSRLFADAVRYHMGISGGKDAEAADKIPGNVEQLLAGKDYSLNGTITDKGLVVTAKSGGLTYFIWPTARLPNGDAAVPKDNPYSKLTGPAHAMDGSVSSVDAAFEANIELADKRSAKQVKLTADAALYETVDPIGKDKAPKYYLMFKYKALDPTEEKVFRQKPFEAFGEANPYPGADKLVVGGLTSGAVVKDRVAAGHRWVPDSNEKRGVLALFQNKQVSGDNQKDKAANCVGPVAWWGVSSRDAALKACQDDKF